MKAGRLLSLGFACVLLATVSVAAGATPLAGPCAPGTTYDPTCDVNQDNAITIADIQLTAGHWNQTGTWVSDNNHNHLGQTWTGTNNPLKIEGSFGSPDNAGLVLSNSSPSDGDGLRISSASRNGVYVDTAGRFGVGVNDAGVYGVWVNSTGDDGVVVNSAGDNGLFVGSAATVGVWVYSAGYDGVAVNSAGYNGVYANTAQANGQWGFYTDDAIHGSNVLMHSLSLVAQVAGPDSLTLGDVVAVAGVADPMVGSTVHVPLVHLADGTATGVVGVVEGRLALNEQPKRPQAAEGEEPVEAPPSELRSTDGPAQAGDYVAITVLGAAQVKVQDGEIILTGQRLTAGDHGSVRALQSRTVEGMVVTEGAPTLGVALEAAKDGLVWVLVNPQ